MEAKDRKIKMAFLRRQEDRRRRLPVFLEQLGRIAGFEILDENVLSIEQIDKHALELNGTDFNFNYLNLSFPFDKAADLLDILQSLKSELSKNNYLSMAHTLDIAVMDMNTEFILYKFEEVVKFDRDTLNIYDHKYANGIAIDLYQDSWFLDGRGQFVWIYELRVFGKEWIRKVGRAI